MFMGKILFNSWLLEGRCQEKIILTLTYADTSMVMARGVFGSYWCKIC
jgi:hypothetical protein